MARDGFPKELRERGLLAGSLSRNRDQLLGIPPVEGAVQGHLSSSLAEARCLVASGGLRINDERGGPERHLSANDPSSHGWALIRRGPKGCLLIERSDHETRVLSGAPVKSCTR
jgi:tyrosyl-tRNA synthetase